MATETQSPRPDLPETWDALAAMRPLRPIADRDDMDTAAEFMDRLAQLDESAMTADQSAYLDALSTLVDAYETRHHPLGEDDPSAIDLLANLSTELKDEVLKTLQESRSMMAQSTRTLLRTSSVISSTQEALATTTPKIDEALDLLAASLARTDSILADLGPRIGPLQDSLLATLGQARLLMGTLDTLATDASIMLEENRSLVSEALLNLMNTTRVLDNFAIQVTQRPLRLLTGVKPPAADTGGARR